jgi:hypothetical protein
MEQVEMVEDGLVVLNLESLIMVIIRDLKAVNHILWVSGDEGYYLRDKVFGDRSHGKILLVVSLPDPGSQFVGFKRTSA